MNGLWASRMNELVDKHKDIEAKEIKKFFQQTSRQDRLALKQLCDQRADFRIINQQYMKAQKQITTQKIEIGELKYQQDQLREDYETVELINKVKEQDKIIAELEHKEAKLKENNEEQYRLYMKDIEESGNPDIAQRKELQAC